MIHVSIIDDNIVGSYGDKPFSVPANLDLYNELVELADVANSAPSMETYIACLDTFESLVQVDYTKVVEHGANGLIHINPATKEFFLKHNDVVSTVPMPQALVDRIYDSIDKSINFMPLVKMWTRWLRNPILMKKGGTDFSNRFFNFVNMKYVHPKLKQELMEEFGLSEEVAEKRATMYQMKITQEGLLNGYKVSSEILHKYDTETGEEVPRYTRTFNPDTGEIDSKGLPEHVEDRLFEPAMMGTSGDAFHCEGINGSGLGHFIRVGCSHYLDSWDQVNTNDDQSCVKGLHVGGLRYIAYYSGEIHNIFIDPMHIGAVPDDVDGAIRCKQYFVHSSLSGVNGSIYHSSTYAAKTDEEWAEMRAESIATWSKEAKEIVGKATAIID
tara:strand:+ start:1031 stop:2185 length:1155 start_codon:yes stop_codon:yes gene_type:complete